MYRFFCFLILSLNLCLAQRLNVSGVITDSENQPVSFASVLVKGTSFGTSANQQGFYSLELLPGNYVLEFRLIGYKTQQLSLAINQNTIKNVVLDNEGLKLSEVEVISKEDPAYNIIRKAQAKRKYYLQQIDNFSCDVYIKGVQRLNKFPKKIFGLEVNGSGKLDTGIVYLSESLSKFKYSKPDKIKEEMISSKVSGRNNAFSYNQASDMLFNFYENVIQVKNISERGFESPISSSALAYYKFKLIGSFNEDGKEVFKIQVIPKRTQEPLFSGFIYIQDDAWRIHSVDLYLTKSAGINFIDTLTISQTNAPINEDVWVTVNNKYAFIFNVMGFSGNGYYLGVNRNYLINQTIQKKTFSNEVLKIDNVANKKTDTYWDSIRPVSLTNAEIKDYRKKDSLSKIWNSKQFKDSIDHKNNKFKFANLIFGYTFRNSFNRESHSISAPLLALQFNTVQGWNTGINYTYRKRNDSLVNSYGYKAGFNYGFDSKQIIGSIGFFKRFNNVHYDDLNISAGRELFQWNSLNPISEMINTSYSLLNRQNYMKLYQSDYVKVKYQRELVNGLMFYPSVEWNNRTALINHSKHFWAKNKNQYTVNNPIESLPEPAFNADAALLVNIGFRVSFKQTYTSVPYQKIINETKYPRLFINYKQAIPLDNKFYVDYKFVSFKVSDDISFKRIGETNYQAELGYFFDKRKMNFIDYQHYMGNQIIYQEYKQNSFFALPFYNYSTNDYSFTFHGKHNFNTFLFSKIPLIKKLKLQELISVNYLYNNNLKNYTELAFGIQRSMFRADYYFAFLPNSKTTNGFRIGLLLN